jgi:hypothetical protein
MTIQVKLFWDRVNDTFEGTSGSVHRMENDMNDFLKDIRDDNVKKIYIALGNTQRMGLIEYRNDTFSSNNNKEINIDQYSVNNPPPGFNSKEWGNVEKMIAENGVMLKK